jgi:hypothetical protein
MTDYEAEVTDGDERDEHRAHLRGAALRPERLLDLAAEGSHAPWAPTGRPERDEHLRPWSGHLLVHALG